MKITNTHNIPDVFMRYAKLDKYSKGDSDISVTTLIDSPRIAKLRQIHEETLTKDISEMTFALLGTAVHGILEDTGPSAGEVYEERLYATIFDTKLSGAIDVQKFLPDGSVLIQDYKVCSVWSVLGDKPEWERQLNCYAWLVEHSKQVPVGGLQIVAILRDWQRSKAQFQADYPPTNVVVVDVPLWDSAQRSSYIEERVLAHHNLQENIWGDAIPFCSDADRWAKPTQWAVMKKGRKSAVKLFDDAREAELFIKNSKDAGVLSVETRLGEFTRCENNYCGVAQYCSQHTGVDNEQSI
jgi:hypothetical protein